LSYRYGFATGGLGAVLTWSFFVLGTPVADAGFLLDFPLRLLFGIRMLVSETWVRVVAIAVNGLALAFSSDAYETTFLTSILKKIILHPYPYWIIIVLSGIGTFLSILFGDELMDAIRHESVGGNPGGLRVRLVSMAIIFVLTFWAYGHFMAGLGIDLSALGRG
jgi:hypothetical protein